MSNRFISRLRAGNRRDLLPPAFGAALLCVVSLTPVAHAGAGLTGQSPAVTAPRPGMVSATLEQCVTSVDQSERAATFAGEMATIAGSSRMQMRIDVLERLPGEFAFHTVSAPGLGAWRTAAAGVKSYRYLKEATNLAAPAFYRGAVRFRWLNSRGRLIRAVELRTARCQQPAPPSPIEATTPRTLGA